MKLKLSLKVSIPKISVPKLSLPKISFPKISLPRISPPKITLPSRNTVIVMLILLLAGAGGYLGYRHFFYKEPLSWARKNIIDPYALPATIGKANMSWRPESLVELEEDSAYVVRGYLLPSARTVLEYRTEEGMEHLIRGGFTLSALVVSESYKGPLQPGDKIPFVERYYYAPDEEAEAQDDEGDSDEPVEPPLRLFTINNYMPTVSNSEHIFFLSRQPVESSLFPGCYFLKCMELGKYPCLTPEQLEAGYELLDNKALGLNVDTSEEDRAAYLSIFGEIIDKFAQISSEENQDEESPDGEAT